jgi:hypothetical protein
VTAVVTAASGYDLGYAWHNQTARGRREGTEREQAWDRGWLLHPEGRADWPAVRQGTEALGLEQGQEAEREPYDTTYQRVDPPTSEQIGRKLSARISTTCCLTPSRPRSRTPPRSGSTRCSG